MKTRLNTYTAAPDQMRALIDFSTAMAKSGIDESLHNLINIRVSQINGCSFCLHMHSREALAAGESELRITMLGAWHESPLYSDRERAALAWAEALTRLPETGAPDDVYAAMAEHFSPEEQVKLTMAIGIINLWNRFGVGFRGIHPVAAHQAAAA
jgi:AhpD family alkylhydroperoxidase